MGTFTLCPESNIPTKVWWWWTDGQKWGHCCHLRDVAESKHASLFKTQGKTCLAQLILQQQVPILANFKGFIPGTLNPCRLDILRYGGKRYAALNRLHQKSVSNLCHMQTQFGGWASPSLELAGFPIFFSKSYARLVDLSKGGACPIQTLMPQSFVPTC